MSAFTNLFECKNPADQRDCRSSHEVSQLGTWKQAQVKLALIGQCLKYLPITPLVSGSSCEEPGILIGWQTILLSSYCYAQSVTLINVIPLLHEFENFSPSHDSIKLPPRSRAS